MLAMVRDGDGKPVTLHRTFLRPDGSGKAEMRSPRKLMPGPVPAGSAIRLGPVREVLGIAEGIETALAASMMFKMPVWSVINAAGMSSWSPPEGVSEVHIFGDCDEGFGGPRGRVHPGPSARRQGRGGGPSARGARRLERCPAGKDRCVSWSPRCPGSVGAGAQPAAGSLDLDTDGVVQKAIGQRGGDGRRGPCVRCA